MKYFFFLFFSSLLAFVANAQKTINDPNAEVRVVQGSFRAIQVDGGIDLYLSQGDEAVAVSARDAETRGRIRTEITNGVLKIWYEWKQGVKLSMNISRNLKAYVSYNALEKISASTGSDVVLYGTLKTSTLTLNISGGSDFRGAVEVDVLKVDQSGGSDIDISGKAQTLSIEASGGSDFDGYDLITDTCTADASGGSDINITVNKELSAEASGASDIIWKGKATVKRSAASGAGSVSHRS